VARSLPTSSYEQYTVQTNSVVPAIAQTAEVQHAVLASISAKPDADAPSQSDVQIVCIGISQGAIDPAGQAKVERTPDEVQRRSGMQTTALQPATSTF
jgi:hypothetical protein